MKYILFGAMLILASVVGVMFHDLGLGLRDGLFWLLVVIVLGVMPVLALRFGHLLRSDNQS